MKINCLVLRTPNLSDMRTFYSALGAQFQLERHGSGVEHYAAVMNDGMVLELYPSRHGNITDTELRLGLNVEDLAETLHSLGQSAASRPTKWGLKALVKDPDGRMIELSQTEAHIKYSKFSAAAATSHQRLPCD